MSKYLKIQELIDKASKVYGNTPQGREFHDGDTILKDQIDSLEEDDYTGIFPEMAQIWKETKSNTEKEVFLKLFECFTGMSFQDYLQKSVYETTK